MAKGISEVLEDRDMDMGQWTGREHPAEQERCQLLGHQNTESV